MASLARPEEAYVSDVNADMIFPNVPTHTIVPSAPELIIPVVDITVSYSRHQETESKSRTEPPVPIYVNTVNVPSTNVSIIADLPIVEDTPIIQQEVQSTSESFKSESKRSSSSNQLAQDDTVFLKKIGTSFMSLKDKLVGNKLAGVQALQMQPRRQILQYTISSDHTGFKAYVSLLQPYLRFAWSNPQGIRPSMVSIGTFSTMFEAKCACLTYSPPCWQKKDPEQARCSICTQSAGVFKHLRHCRNCGFIFCKSCMKTQWPASMVPWTYHNRERKIRVCDTCHTAMELFRNALLKGDETLAHEIFRQGNVNLWFPYAIFPESEYPVHCAARGGNLNLLIWLVDQNACSLDEKTSEEKSAMSIAIETKNVLLMQWLLSKGRRANEISSLSHIAGALDIALRFNPLVGTFTPSKLLLSNTALDSVQIVWNSNSSSSITNYSEESSILEAVPVDSRNIISEEERKYYFMDDDDEEKKDAYASPYATNTNTTNDDDRNDCIVCFAQPIDCVIVPCGHYCSCSSCASQFGECPVCRNPITQIVKTQKVH